MFFCKLELQKSWKYSKLKKEKKEQFLRAIYKQSLGDIKVGLEPTKLTKQFWIWSRRCRQWAEAPVQKWQYSRHGGMVVL